MPHSLITSMRSWASRFCSTMKTSSWALMKSTTSWWNGKPRTRMMSIGMPMDIMRVRGFPFHQDVVDFINAHDEVFIVEQNRDAQLRMLVINECGIDPARLVPVLHYDGTPITAQFISEGIAMRLKPPVQQRLKEAV